MRAREEGGTSCARFPESGWIATISKPRYQTRRKVGHAILEKAISDQHFTLFDTPIGVCGIEWGPRGINGVQLPMGSEDKTRARIRQRRGDIAEAAPTAEVQRAIGRIVDLLAGKQDDLTDIPLDLEGVPEFNRGVYDIARAIPP